MPVPGSPSVGWWKTKAPIQSALAERLGWAEQSEASQSYLEAMEVSPASYSKRLFTVSLQDAERGSDRQRRQRGGSLRTRDAYGRLKVRTPEERRQRAMVHSPTLCIHLFSSQMLQMSGPAMEMALEGRLDEFDPESYTEPEIDIEVFEAPLQPRRGRGSHSSTAKG